MKISRVSFFMAGVFFMLSAAAGNKVNPDALNLYPIPLPVEMQSDIDAPVDFNASTVIVVDCPGNAGVEWLKSHIKEWYGKFAPSVKAGETGMELLKGEEAYAISADASGVKIKARSIAGVRWAAYSIRQILIAKRRTVKIDGYILPTLKISDAPHLSFRGIHLCWFPETDSVQIERYIRLAALMKFNYVVLEPWGMYRSAKHPWWGWESGKMTKEKVRSLVKLGKDLGITLIPQIAAYGHATASRSLSLKHSVLDFSPEYEPLFEPGGWNWCLTNPETQRIIRELILELLEDFDNPPFIHLGCDEAQPPSCPDCRKRPYGEIVCEHITNLAKFTKEHGARAMIWHDMLLDRKDPRWKGFTKYGSAATSTLADTLSKDVIICDWQYSKNLTPEQMKEWPTIKYFLEKGFPVAGCPKLNHNAMKPMADFIAKNGGFGYLQTTWQCMRGFDFTIMLRSGSTAAWGTEYPEDMPQYDTPFAIAVRLVGSDMKIKDYRFTGRYDYQIPPGWWPDR
jgi:hypothetical protein